MFKAHLYALIGLNRTSRGYIGRITVMASFGMVFSGGPLFMWVHAIKAAAFINNITATVYAKIGVWATPYELVRCA
jgi:hypothetical protein